jgi:hypothetical protein
MVFSKRTDWALEPNRLALRLAEHRRSGRALVDLAASNPTQVGLPLPEAEIRAALADPALRYDPEPLGRREAREAVSRQIGGAVPPERIALCASTSEAYAWCLKLLCEPGDRVLVPVPGYPLVDYLAALEGVSVDHAPLFLAGDRFAFDWADLEGRIRPRTRALVVASPSFPTGAVLRGEELERLAGICARRSLALVVDEVFAAWRAADDAASTAVAGTGPALCFALAGLSKLCLLPQLKLAWIAVGGPPAEVEGALRRLEAIADAYLPVNTPVELALPRLLELGTAIRAPLCARLAANRATLERLARDGPCRPLPSEGGWSAVLRVPRTRSDEEWALRLLDEEGLCVHPGFLYDFPSEGWLVLGLLPPQPVFADAAGRLLACIARGFR